MALAFCHPHMHTHSCRWPLLAVLGESWCLWRCGKHASVPHGLTALTCLASVASPTTGVPPPSSSRNAVSRPSSRPARMTLAPGCASRRRHSAEPMPPEAPNTTYTAASTANQLFWSYDNEQMQVVGLLPLYTWGAPHNPQVRCWPQRAGQPGHCRPIRTRPAFCSSSRVARWAAVGGSWPHCLPHTPQQEPTSCACSHRRSLQTTTPGMYADANDA